MVDTTYNEQIQNTLVHMEERVVTQPDTVTLSSGVVVRSKDVPKPRIIALLEQFPDPEVPLVENKDKGRMERNPKSESYIEAVNQVNMRRGLAMLDIIIVSGTEIVSVPEGFPKVEDTDWIEELELSHIPVRRSSPLARKFAWLKYVACTDDSDYEKLLTRTQMQVGDSEAHVAQQLQENFQDI